MGQFRRSHEAARIIGNRRLAIAESKWRTDVQDCDTDILRKALSKQNSRLKAKTKIEAVLGNISQMTCFSRVQKKDV